MALLSAWRQATHAGHVGGAKGGIVGICAAVQIADAPFAVGARAIQAGLTVSECSQLTRSVTRTERSIAKEKAETGFAVLDEVSSGRGAEEVRNLVNDVPSFNGMTLESRPDSLCFRVGASPIDSEMLTRALAWAHDINKTVNFF